MTAAWEKFGQFTDQTDTGDAPAGAGDYTAIEASDDSRWVSDLTGHAHGEYDSQMYEFSIPEDPSSLEYIEVWWEGQGWWKAGSEVPLQIWNYNTSSWDFVRTRNSIDHDQWLGNTLTNPEDYISGGKLYVTTSARYTKGGACPFVYGWNGEEYEFIEAVLSTSIIKRYESTTFAGTSMLQPKDGYYDLILAMQLPETAYINNLGLWAVDHPEGTEVWADQLGNVHTISNPQSVGAADRDGTNITPLLAGRDSQGWSSSFAGRDLNNTDDLFDWITLTLPQDQNDGTTAKLLLDMGQTPLNELTLWYYFHYFLGTPNLDYLIDRAENDPEFIPLFDQAVACASTVVLQYWVGTDWVDYEYLFNYPLDFNQRIYVVPLDMSVIQGNQLRLLFPVGWVKFNYVAVDYTPDEEVNITELQPTAATEYFYSDVSRYMPYGDLRWLIPTAQLIPTPWLIQTADVLDEITAADDSYAVIEQGDYINYRFAALPPPQDGLHRSFVIPAGGYYYITGSAVPQDKMYNVPLLESVSQTPYKYNKWILPRYLNPLDYPYIEYYYIKTIGPPFDTTRYSLDTDYVKVITSTCPVPEQEQPSYGVGNWWLWKVYYNSEDSDNIINTTYMIENVIESGVTTYGKQSESATWFTITNARHTNLNTDEINRERKVPAPLVGSTLNYMLDAEYWLGALDSTQWARMGCAPAVPEGSTGAGDVPTNNYYAYDGDNSYNASDIGYPYNVGDTWSVHEYINAIAALQEQHMVEDYDWEVISYITGYNVSDPATCPDIQGVGVYDVYRLEHWIQGTPGVTCKWWYSPEVRHWVRKLDELRYFGREDNVIIAYEVADFAKSDLVVTPDPPSQGDTITVSLNVTNTTGEATSFNLVLLVMDMDAVTPLDGEPYVNGKTVFPDMSSPDLGVWPYFSAIQQTSVLNPSESETVTWSNIWTVADSGPYELWCSGFTYSWR